MDHLVDDRRWARRWQGASRAPTPGSDAGATIELSIRRPRAHVKDADEIVERYLEPCWRAPSRLPMLIPGEYCDNGNSEQEGILL
jgi:hypothetical protein